MYKYPKHRRLLKSYEFVALSQKAFCFKGKILLIFYKFNARNQSRLGITVTKKYAKAVGRNRFKRYVREAFRLIARKDLGVDLNVRPRVSAETHFDFKDVYSDLEAFFTSI